MTASAQDSKYAELIQKHLEEIHQMQVNLFKKKNLLSHFEKDKAAIILDHQEKTQMFALPIWVEWAKKNPTLIATFSNPGYVGEKKLTKKDDKELQAGLLKADALVPNIKNILKSDTSAAEKLIQGRSFSKYRMSAGPLLTLHNKSFFAILGCAINLMGSSPADEAKYTKKITEKDEFLTLIEEAYQSDTTKIIDLLFQICQVNKKTELVMPDFGIGEYLGELTEESKEQARKIMRETVAKIAVYYKIHVIWVIWDRQDNVRTICDGLNKTYESAITFIPGDFLKKIDESKDNQAFLIPGSDCTVGGRFYSPKKTLEEQIAKHTTLVETRSVCFNPFLKDKYENIIKSTTTLTVSPHQKMNALIHSLNEKKLGASFHFMQSSDQRVIFNSQDKADDFAVFCGSHKIYSKNGSQQLKTSLPYQSLTDENKYMIVLEQTEANNVAIKEHISEHKLSCESNVSCFALFEDRTQIGAFLSRYELDPQKLSYTGVGFSPGLFSKSSVGIYLGIEELSKIETLLIDPELRILP